MYRVGSQFPELYAMIPGTRDYMAHVSGQDITGYPIRICGTRRCCSGMIMSAGMAERREAELHRNSLVMYSLRSIPEKNVGMYENMTRNVTRQNRESAPVQGTDSPFFRDRQIVP
jgi:hypothetical protein